MVDPRNANFEHYMPPEDYYIDVIRDCENKCGNLTVEGRNICYDCIVSERDRIIDHGDQG